MLQPPIHSKSPMPLNHINISSRPRRPMLRPAPLHAISTALWRLKNKIQITSTCRNVVAKSVSVYFNIALSLFFSSATLAAASCDCLKRTAYSTAPGNLHCLVMDEAHPPCHLRWLRSGDGSNVNAEPVAVEFLTTLLNGEYGTLPSPFLGQSVIDIDTFHGILTSALPDQHQADELYQASVNYLQFVSPDQFMLHPLGVTILMILGTELHWHVQQLDLRKEYIHRFALYLNKHMPDILTRMRPPEPQNQDSVRNYSEWSLTDRSSLGCFELIFDDATSKDENSLHAIMLRSFHSTMPRCMPR